MRPRALVSNRPISMALATALLALLFIGATPSSPFVTTAQAVNATHGSGSFKDSIEWVEWPEFSTRDSSNTIRSVATVNQVGNGKIETYCTAKLQWNSDGIISYQPANDRADDFIGYSGDGFAVLYRNSAGFRDNRMRVAIANQNIVETAKFDFRCFADFYESTGNGQFGAANPVPIQGLVVADAESSNKSQDEYIRVTPKPEANSTVSWRILERYRVANCTTGIDATLTAGQVLKLQSNGEQCADRVNSGNGPTAIAYMQGAHAAGIELKGGGKSAVALGAVFNADFGDAPNAMNTPYGFEANYGEAGALINMGWKNTPLAGGISGTTVHNVFGLPAEGASTSSYAKLSSPEVPSGQVRLGAGITAETAYRGTDITATGDADDALRGNNLGEIARPDGSRLQSGDTFSYSNITCVGANSPVAGWIDWNLNGEFDANEKSADARCTNGRVTLNWSVPASINYANTADSYYVRLRIAGTGMNTSGTGNTLAPTGLTVTGEVEDYLVKRVRPAMSIDKSASVDENDVITTGTKIDYTVVLTNVGNGAFDRTLPAAAKDAIGEVLTHADLVEKSAGVVDVVASRGEISYDASTKAFNWSSGAEVIKAGDKITLTYSVLVKDHDATIPDEFTNTAWVVNHVGTDTVKNKAGQSVPAVCPNPGLYSASSGWLICDEVTLYRTNLNIEKSLHAEVPGVEIPSGTVLEDGTYYYLIKIENRGSKAVKVDYVDNYADVLDDAAVEPASRYDSQKRIQPGSFSDFKSWPNVQPVTVAISQPTPHEFKFSGRLGAKEGRYLSYKIVVDSDVERDGDNLLRNVLHATGTDPECLPGSKECVVTEHPIVAPSTVTVTKAIADVDGTPIESPLPGELQGWEFTLGSEAAASLADGISATKTSNELGKTGTWKITHDDGTPKKFTLTETQASQFYEVLSYVCTGTRSNGALIPEFDPNEVEQGQLTPGSTIDCIVTNQRIPGTITWNKVDSADPTILLAGSKWNVTAIDGEVTEVSDCEAAESCAQASGLTDIDATAGKFKLDQLPWGTYSIEESKAPLGFEISPAIQHVTVGPDTQLDLDLGDIENTKRDGLVIPLTGGLGQDWFIGVGAALLLLAASIAFVKKRRAQLGAH